jgi:hypothetical protein
VIIAILLVLYVNAVERETEQRRMVCGARDQSCNCHVQIRMCPLEKRQRITRDANPNLRWVLRSSGRSLRRSLRGNAGAARTIRSDSPGDKW